jgi:excisionase family DNA binding protein
MPTITHLLPNPARQAEPVSVPASQREDLAALLRLVQRTPSEGTSYKLVSPTGEARPIPAGVLALFEQAAESLSRGDAVALVPVEKELSTQQAANLLNVSRQYIVQLLNEERIPHRRTGTHRRLRLEDVLAFKRQRDQDRMAALDEIARMSQEFGGYDELPGASVGLEGR